jgi:hypothetical protein
MQTDAIASAVDAALDDRASSRYSFVSLFTPENYSPKTDKGATVGYRTGIMYFAPANQSGYDVCQYRSKGCERACLNTAGHGGIGIDMTVLVNDDTNTNPVQRCRNARTRWFFERRAEFNARLLKETEGVRRLAKRDRRLPAVRPNGTSDLPWERMPVKGTQTLMQAFPDVTFYDYTKNVKRALANAKGEHPANYYLTFSRSEDNEADCLRVLAAGGNVAVVFNVKKGGPLPETWHGYRVINGDKHDLRFLDPKGVVVGLTAKGRAKKDTSGFVVAA